MSTIRNSLPVVVLALSAAPALAGNVFRMTADGVEAQTMYVQDGMLRIDDSTTAQSTTVIFKSGELLVLNPAQRNFVRMTPETIAELGALVSQANEQMSAAMQQMQAQLQNLPPQQREMMERMMRDRMPGLGTMLASAVPELRVERGGSSASGDYACTEHTVFADDERVQEICAADFGSVPGANEIEAVIGEMGAFFERFREAISTAPALSSLQTNPFEIMKQIDGMPVRTRQFRDGALQQELVLSSAESQSLEASLFEPPAGYVERSVIPESPPGSRGR